MLKTISILGLVLHSLLVIRPAVAATIPSPTQTLLQSTRPSPSASSKPLSITSTSSVPVTQPVAEQQPETGNNYALDPFEFLGSSENQGNGGGDSQQTKQSPASKAAETNSGVVAATGSLKAAPNSSPSTATKTGETTKTGSATTKAAASTAIASSTEPFGSAYASTSTTSPEATPSQADEGTDDTVSSGSGMNAWKVLGIGVLAFVGVVLLVLCTAFQDTILRVLCQPFRRRKDDEEVLVPDWRRGSWRFGEDGVSIEKPRCLMQDEERPRIGENEKGSLAVPLPPISPFPLRRTPSAASAASRTTTRPQAEHGLAGVGAGNAAALKTQNNNYSTLPSPPPVHPPEPSREKRKSMRDPFASPRGSMDAYGGIE